MKTRYFIWKHPNDKSKYCEIWLKNNKNEFYYKFSSHGEWFKNFFLEKHERKSKGYFEQYLKRNNLYIREITECEAAFLV